MVGNNIKKIENKEPSQFYIPWPINDMKNKTTKNKKKT